MAMTQSALLFMGSLAALVGYLGLFKRFDDNWTPVLLIFGSAMLWGAFGLSAGDVIVSVSDTGATSSEPIFPLFYLGIGLAFVMALFGVFELITAFGSDAADVDADPLKR
jgi:uncharacterized membrane protein YuzA (DUF378 family)